LGGRVVVAWGVGLLGWGWRGVLWWAWAGLWLGGLVGFCAVLGVLFGVLGVVVRVLWLGLGVLWGLVVGCGLVGWGWCWLCVFSLIGLAG